MKRNIREDMNRDLHIDNRSLVEECLKGDREALSLFYTRFAPKMLALIRRYVSDPMDAEDILHDGFIVAFTRLRTLRDYDHADYWLATIMKNLALQFLHLQDVGAMLHDIPDTADTPAIDEFLDMETLESLIKELPAGYQKVFRLAVLEKKSHNDIARILGISPKSSSSQLFRARMMMQRLIKDYRAQAGALILILAAIPAGIYLTRADKEAITDASTVIPPASTLTAPPTDPTTHLPATPIASASITTVPNRQPSAAPSSSLRTAAIHTMPDTVATQPEDTPREPQPQNDQQPGDTNPPLPAADGAHYQDDAPLYADIPLPRAHGSHTTPEWSLGIGVNPGIANFNARGNGVDGDASAPPDYTNPVDPDKKPEDQNAPAPPTRASSSFLPYDAAPHRNSLPVSASLLVARRLTGSISAETGLTYTYLHTEFKGIRSTADCRWHYLGIPLRVRFNLLSSGRLALYASTGAQLDIPLYSEAEVTTTQNPPDLKAGRFSSPAVWSLSAGFGAAIKLTDHFEIFLEPTLQYRFDHEYKVPNIWTDDPVGFSLPIGLRFNM